MRAALLAGLGHGLCTLLDQVFPRHCIGCGHGVSDPVYRHLCARCRGGLSFIEGATCHRCGRPLDGAFSEAPICAPCREDPPAFSQCRVLLRYEGMTRRLIQELKYHRGSYLKPDIAALLRRPGDWEFWCAGAAPVLVPVPLHPARERARGFNQSRLIASALRSALPACTLDTRLLRRHRATQAQTRLQGEARRANLQGAFSLCRGARIDPQACYLLVDDVYTTGTTLNTCARLLRAEGASEVWAFALAQG